MANNPANFPYEITPGNRWLTWGGFCALNSSPSIQFSTGGDVRYMPLLDTTNGAGSRPYRLRMLKSTDRGATWSEVDAGNGPQVGTNTKQEPVPDIAIFDGVKDYETFNACFDPSNGNIHVVFWSTTSKLAIITFSTSSDIWGSSSISTIDYNNYTTNPQWGLLVGFRPSDGAIWIAWMKGGDIQTNNVGADAKAIVVNNNERDIYAVKYSGSWGTPSLLFGSANDGYQYEPLGAGTDTDGRFHVVALKRQKGRGSEISFDVDTTTTPGHGILTNASVTAGGSSYVGPDATGTARYSVRFAASNGSIVNTTEPLVDVSSGVLSNITSVTGDRLLASFPLPWYSYVLNITGKAWIVSKAILSSDAFSSEVIIETGAFDESDASNLKYASFGRCSNVRQIATSLLVGYTAGALNNLTSYSNGSRIRVATATPADSPSWSNTTPPAFNPFGATTANTHFIDFANVNGNPVALLNQYRDNTFNFVDYATSVLSGDWGTPSVFASSDENLSQFIFRAQIEGAYFATSDTLEITFIYGSHFVAPTPGSPNYLVGQAYWTLTPPPIGGAFPGAFPEYIKRRFA